MAIRKFLSAADVESAADTKYEEVEVPEWGGTIRLRSMTAGQSMRQLVDLKRFPDDGMCIILMYSAVDENDNLVYSMDRVNEEGVPFDLIMLRSKSMAVLDRLQRVCVRLNREKSPEETKKA